MPSAFDQMFADSGVPALMDVLGTAEVKYLDPEVDPVTLTAIVGNMEVVEEQGGSSGGRRKRAVRSVIISTDPDSDYGGVASPRLSAEIEMPDGEVWSIEGIEAKGESLVNLTCTRKTVSELSRSGYRGR